jgi:hypothetical protein
MQEYTWQISHDTGHKTDPVFFAKGDYDYEGQTRYVRFGLGTSGRTLCLGGQNECPLLSDVHLMSLQTVNCQ